MQTSSRKPCHHGADVRERHELVFAYGNGRGRNEYAAGVDAMQIDRFRQAQKRLRPIARGVVPAAGKQILLDWELEALVLARRRSVEARRELCRAAVSRHVERAGELETVLGAAALHGELLD